MSSEMNDTPSRLDLDRARAALAKAREESAIAVRAPRPADLSRLREEDERRHRIATRAGSFRMDLRSQLGLADTQGPYSPLPLNMSGVIGHALCDADICTPEPPQTGAADRPKAQPAPAISGERVDAGFAGEAQAVQPVAPDADADWADGTPERQAPRKRKKFLGLF